MPAAPPRLDAPSESVSGSWWHRLAALLAKQWILVCLLGIVWCGDMLLTIERVQHPNEIALLTLPGTAMCVLALAGWRNPTYCGVLAAAVLSAGSVLMYSTDVYPYAVSFGFVQPAEDAAGVLLVLYVFWKRGLAQAVPVTAILVIACLGSIILRLAGADQWFGLTIALGVGFLQLVLAVGTGIYLGGWRPGAVPPHADTPIRTLMRRQWPTMAMLTVAVFGEALISVSASTAALLPFLGAVAVAGLAVVAPVRPNQAALLGAATVALLALLMWLLKTGSYLSLISNVPLSITAAGMLLVVFSTRYSTPRKAVLNTAALVGSALLAAFLIPSTDGTALTSSDEALTRTLWSALVFGGILLVAAVGTGLYFRARDAERARSVEDAISRAQQNERIALARELHDIVAHHVTGIVVQAQAAQLASTPKASEEALERIANTGAEALTAMRRLVSSMRAEPPETTGSSETTDLAEQATMDLAADLRALVARANGVIAEQGHGRRVELRSDLDIEVPPEVARSALRVVQEALTNSEKHASDADRVVVYVGTTETHLHLQVTDNGSAKSQPIGGSGGYGLVGMRERVELLGGWFRAGPSGPSTGERTEEFGGGGHGWVVDAWLPWSEEGTQ